MSYDPTISREQGTVDASKVVLYGKTNVNAREATPILKHELSPSYSPIASGTSGGLALASATVAVTLGTGTCVAVDISAAGGVLAIGGANANAVTYSGIILTPGSTVYRVQCSNLNEVFVAGASGTYASYIAYN